MIMIMMTAANILTICSSQVYNTYMLIMHILYILTTALCGSTIKDLVTPPDERRECNFPILPGKCLDKLWVIGNFHQCTPEQLGTKKTAVGFTHCVELGPVEVLPETRANLVIIYLEVNLVSIQVNGVERSVTLHHVDERISPERLLLRTQSWPSHAPSSPAANIEMHQSRMHSNRTAHGQPCVIASDGNNQFQEAQISCESRSNRSDPLIAEDWNQTQSFQMMVSA